jgi:hypothetical protein
MTFRIIQLFRFCQLSSVPDIREYKKANTKLHKEDLFLTSGKGVERHVLKWAC